ncbi:MAG TPA: CotH kinase family protein, partial [Saprospiraceae bacterium]|nr:CotH kinase family protein [Saprospiraceae bacterium]
MKKTWTLLLFYPFVAFGQVNFSSSDLPIVVITTPNGQPIPDEPKITAQMKVIDNGVGQVNHLSDPANGYDGFIGIERRGSSSQDLSDKKPFAVETRDANGDDLDVPLLGMPAEADWVFIAPFNDKSLVRDAFTHEVARRILPWSPRTRFVEVMLNGNYQGIYLVTEKIKRDKDRVDISKLTETDSTGDDLTGGYIIKMDKPTGAQVQGWWSPYPAQAGSWQSTFYQYHYPSPEDVQPAQRQYIEDWMTAFEDLMASPQYADTVNGYSKYIDVQSFIDFVIINELTKNVDAYRLSTFLYKDKDSKDTRLHAGPVWDFNIAMGNANYCSADTYTGWAIDFNDVCIQDGWIIHFWWQRLWDDPVFRKKLAARWTELRGDLLKTEHVTGLVDSLVGVLNQSQARNWQRWPVLNEWVWPNAYCCGTYQQHVNYLNNWLVNRLQWMDGKMIALNTGDYYPSEYFKTEVFPNPSDNDLNFKCYVRRTDEVSLRIYDAAGRLIQSLQAPPPTANGVNEYNWQHSLMQGFYFYTVFINGSV